MYNRTECPYGSRSVKRFIEKPNAIKAQELLLQGGVLWNAGIFLVSVSTLLKALETHAPDILKSCEAAMAACTQESGAPSQPGLPKTMAASFLRPEPVAFKACRSESIDYAVMEHFAQVAVVPFKGQWNDVGSWNAVAHLNPSDDNGNRVVGHGVFLNSNHTFIHAPHRTVAALGVQDLMIVDTPDAVLVAHASQSENVKNLVAQLNAEHAQQTITHRKVHRPWGWYDSIDSGPHFQVKRICVNPGAKLSLQLHHHRAEHWIVIQGQAEVTNGAEVMTLNENQSTYIPQGVKHRLANHGATPLEIIEVQSGSYLGEDDIVRFEDHYGRS